MADQYSITSVIICDDVRWEINNKRSMMGVYDSVIVSESFPIWVPLLGMRVTMHIKRSKFENIVSYIVSPSGEELTRINFSYAFGTAKLLAAMYLTFSGFTLSSPGEYLVYYGMDCDPEVIHKIPVLSKEELDALKEE